MVGLPNEGGASATGIRLADSVYLRATEAADDNLDIGVIPAPPDGTV
jgi:hypothetical protein